MQTMLVALRAGRAEHTPEAEPVVIERIGERVVLRLDDGETLNFDAGELCAACADPRGHRMAA